MTIEEGQAFLDGMNTAFNANEKDFYERFWSKKFVGHGTRGEYGLEALKKSHESDRKSFSDLRIKSEVLFTAGDMIAFRLAFSGTHTGVYMGKAPTGRHFKAWGVDVIRVADGKKTDEWPAFDQYNLLEQLGIVPQ